jgi:hypothetical protein
MIKAIGPIYAPYERSAEEITVVGRIWRFARAMRRLANTNSL